MSGWGDEAGGASRQAVQEECGAIVLGLCQRRAARTSNVASLQQKEL